jgi:thiamine biosynthesis lipoprotein
MNKPKISYIKFLFAFLLLLCLLIYWSDQLKPDREQILIGDVFGVERYRITIITNQSESKVEDFQKLILAPFLIAFNQEFSTYIGDSYLSNLNNAELNTTMTTSKNFDTAFEECLNINKESDGAFDPSVAPLINLWGFGEKKHAVKDVTDEEIITAKSEIGLDAFVWKKGSIKKVKKASLNLSSVVEGLAVDLVAKLLDEQGYKNYLIDIGGENYAKGTKIDGTPFKIGIEIPKDKNNSEDDNFECIVQLKDQSIATSGNYKQFYFKDGKRYSHIIDPKTGYPAQNTLASVTVITKKCMRADTINTAFMVMGLEKSLEYANGHPEIDALFILRKNENEFETVMSKGFSKHLTK